MPVTTLYVEGGGNDPVDSAILYAVFAGQPLVEAGGSKGSLKPKVRDARARGIRACYIRDRDFDTDPPQVLLTPTVDTREARSGEVLGWTWCRHEIESYLIDPQVVAHASPGIGDAYRAALLDAADRIQTYTAARWAVGVARRGLPPLKELPTRPTFLTNEFAVVSEWFSSREAPLAWATAHATDFSDEVALCLAPPAIEHRFDETLGSTRAAIAAARRGSFGGLLAWFPGKDLMAAMDPSVYRPLGGNPVELRRALRDWLRAHPGEALGLFPEWEALRTLLQA